MVPCQTEAEADKIKLRLSARRARTNPQGLGELRPAKSSGQHAAIQAAEVHRWLLPPEAAAQFFSVKEDDLAKWRLEGIGPLYLAYPNGAVRYSLEALAAWLADSFYEGGESWERLSAAGALSNAKVQ